MVYLRAGINMGYHYSLMTLCSTLHCLYHALNVGTIHPKKKKKCRYNRYFNFKNIKFIIIKKKKNLTGQ